MSFNNLNDAVNSLQDKMQNVDNEVKTLQVTKEAGAGLVKTTVSGTNRILDITIDDQLMNEEDKEMLQDLIIASVNMAMEEVEEKAKEMREKVSMDILGALAK
ncbi:MAG: YbaB/EbfC family nucleoid-associated protein [Bacteroidota bacterium]